MGIVKIDRQTIVDCHSRSAWIHLYYLKIPVTVVHVLNERVLPFFEELGAHIKPIVSDNGMEYFGRPDQHNFELFLQLEEIENRRTQVRLPQSNGIVECLHRTLSTSISESSAAGSTTRTSTKCKSIAMNTY
jgi:hypothetical protein